MYKFQVFERVQGYCVFYIIYVSRPCACYFSFGCYVFNVIFFFDQFFNIKYLQLICRLIQHEKRPCRGKIKAIE